MTGVEILAIGEMGANEGFNWLAAIVSGLVIGAIGGFIIGMSLESWKIFFVSFAIFSFFVGSIFGFAFPVYQDTIPTYKVIISDEVSMNDFMNRYKILEQEGKIYTVKERMPDAN